MISIPFGDWALNIPSLFYKHRYRNFESLSPKTGSIQWDSVRFDDSYLSYSLPFQPCFEDSYCIIAPFAHCVYQIQTSFQQFCCKYRSAFCFFQLYARFSCKKALNGGEAELKGPPYRYRRMGETVQRTPKEER